MTFIFHPLKRSDFRQFALWLAEPHVSKWWLEPPTVEHVDAEYGGCTRGDMRTRVYVAWLDGRPVGVIQSYIVDDYPEHLAIIHGSEEVGIDYFIGNTDYIGQGYGHKMISSFIDTIVRRQYPRAIAVVADPDVANIASIRSLARAGFTPYDIVAGEHGPEQVMKKPLI
jgi:RimJ/RimL family protein N-acetyltransferase